MYFSLKDEDDVIPAVVHILSLTLSLLFKAATNLIQVPNASFFPSYIRLPLVYFTRTLKKFSHLLLEYARATLSIFSMLSLLSMTFFTLALPFPPIDIHIPLKRDI